MAVIDDVSYGRLPARVVPLGELERLDSLPRTTVEQKEHLAGLADCSG